jgi:hypothetical protein
MVQVQVHFCTRDPNLNPTRPKLGSGFVFHPRVHSKQKKPETQKNPKPERNPKPKKTWKKLKTRKTPETP